MPIMGFKIQCMLSMYEFEEESGKKSAHYTLMDPTPQQIQDLVVVDLWDIRKSLERHKRTLAENAEAFFDMCAEEVFVAMSVNSTATLDILGRIYAVRQMLANPEEIGPLLDEPGFLRHVGEQEYARLKPSYDEMHEL